MEDQELALRCSTPVTVEGTANVPVCYFMIYDALIRKWRPPDGAVEDEWKVVYQIAVPEIYRKEVMSGAHYSPVTGYL